MPEETTTTETPAASPEAEQKKDASKGRGQGGGQQQQRRPRPRSRYGTQMHEKQTLKGVYGVREGQLRRYYREALAHEETTGTRLLQLLEMRLDNAVFRAGFAETRAHARQLVSHNMFTVNGRPINIASYTVRTGDVISIKETKQKKAPFANFSKKVQNISPPEWLELNGEAFSFKVVAIPDAGVAAPGVDMRAIVEFFAR